MMRVTIKMEIETLDYDGEAFFIEIRKLIDSIRQESGDSEDVLRLVKFKMRNKHKSYTDRRDYEWEE